MLTVRYGSPGEKRTFLFVSLGYLRRQRMAHLEKMIQRIFKKREYKSQLASLSDGVICDAH